jgi:hypothetical protein
VFCGGGKKKETQEGEQKEVKEGAGIAERA